MSFGTAFAIATGLNVQIVAAKAIFGFVGYSVALISDAVHNVSDVLGLAVAFAGAGSAHGRRRPASPTVSVVLPAGPPGDAFLMDTCRTLSVRHRIGHATLQIETDAAFTCTLAPDEVV